MKVIFKHLAVFIFFLTSISIYAQKGKTKVDVNTEKAPLITLDFDLSHIPAQDLGKFKQYFKIAKIDKPNNKISLTKDVAIELVSKLVFNKVINEEILSDTYYTKEFYIRANYFYNIFLLTPLSVDQSLRYEEGFYAYTFNQTQESEKYFAYLVRFIGRSPSQVFKIQKLLLEDIYSLLSKDVYEASNLKKYTRSLLDAYDYISTFEEADHILNELYNVQVQQSKLTEIDYGLTQTIYGEYNSRLMPDQEDLQYTNTRREYDSGLKQSTILFYSFWVRRHKEGNAEIVYKILQDIDNQYSN